MAENWPILEIPLSRLVGWPENPRGPIKLKELVELAESMKGEGQLQTIVVRPLRPVGPSDDIAWLAAQPETMLEVVAGERRLEAARMADLPALSCQVRLLNDDEATIIALTENSDALRKNVGPLNEAAAIGRLVRHGRSIEWVSRRLGHSEGWVRNRLALNSLCEPAVYALQEGMLPLRGAVALALLLSEELQVAAWGRLLVKAAPKGATPGPVLERPVTVAEVREAIRHQDLWLDDVAWDLEDETIGTGGACTRCHKRSDAQVDWTRPAGDRAACLDDDCYKTKQAETLARLKGKGERIVQGPPAEDALRPRAAADLVQITERAPLAAASTAPGPVAGDAPLEGLDVPRTWYVDNGRVQERIRRSDLTTALRTGGRDATADAIEQQASPPPAGQIATPPRPRPLVSQVDALMGQLVERTEAAIDRGETPPWHLLVRLALDGPFSASGELADRAARRRGLYSRGADSLEALRRAVVGMRPAAQIGLLVEAFMASIAQLTTGAKAPDLDEVRPLLHFLDWADLYPLPGMDPRRTGEGADHAALRRLNPSHGPLSAKPDGGDKP